MCYSNKSSDKRKQATTSSLSTRISKTYQNIIKFKWCGSGLKNQQISGGIFRYLAVSSDITHTSTKYWLVTWNIPKARRRRQAPMKPAYEAQVCLTLAWPGRTESRPVICRPTWPLANTEPTARAAAYPFYRSNNGFGYALRIDTPPKRMRLWENRRLWSAWVLWCLAFLY